MRGIADQRDKFAELMVEISDRVWKAVMPEPEDEVVDVTDEAEDDEFSDADDMPIALDD